MKRNGFTLIELLVVLAVIALLTSLSVPAVSSVLRKGQQVREMSAARMLGQAYQLYATDHRGRYLAGYDPDESARDGEGNRIPFPVNARYPWRLAPYVGYNISGVYHLDSELARRDGEAWEDYLYRVSVYPALGMNVFFVGGDHSGESGQGLKPVPEHEAHYGVFCVTRSGQAVSPSSLIVFASARHELEGRSRSGYYRVESPRFTGPRWSASLSADAPARDSGFVDLRWGGKAVTTMLDGSVHLLGEEALRDMRHWSNQAAEAGDPDWTLTRR